MPRRGLVALLLVATALVGSCRDEAPEDPGYHREKVVATDAGDVRGVEHDGVISWKGLPYAAAPVGDLRWRPPEPAQPWSGTRKADEYGAICPQDLSGSLAGALGDVPASDEDCLTLNVHRPADARDDLPVMVWVHGGGFVTGSGSQAMYNSPELVRRGVVLVTINYRLGRLGFFAHPAVQEDGHRLANFGLLDQVAALTWVRDNIGAFGGDADNVTLFGESAGAISVSSLMASPAAEGLFDRAISQSGFGREPNLSWEGATADAAAAVAGLAGPDPSADDLRALDADELARIPTELLDGQVPVLDEVLPTSVAAAFEAGDEAQVPFLVGTTDLEISPDFVSPGPVVGAVRALLLAERDRVEPAYGSAAELDRHLLADTMFTEPARHLALLHADESPAFRYLFRIATAPVLESAGGAPHASELVFVFDDTRRQGTPVENADALADEVADLWVDFATDGEPDGWPRADTGRLLTFALTGAAAGPDPWTARLDVVESGYDRVGNGVASAD